MVWYGKSWDDKLDDWTHEDDGPSAPPRTRRQFNEYIEPPLCTAQKDDPNHSWSYPYSGRYRCRRCGFDYEPEHIVVGHVVIGLPDKYTIHSTGDRAKQRAAE